MCEVCVCAYVYMHCVHMCADPVYIGQRLVFFYLFPILFFLRQNPSLGLELAESADWLAGELQGTLCLCLPSAGSHVSSATLSSP